MTTRMSNEEEMFPLSALLYNKAHEPLWYYGDMSMSDVYSEKNEERRVNEGVRFSRNTALYNDTSRNVLVSYVDGGTESKSFAVQPGASRQLPDGTFLIDDMKAALGDPGNYWYRFGIEQVELPEGCSRVAAVWDRVCLRFNETYYDRFLAGETMEQWQRRLQVTTDFTVPRIDRAMKMYSDYADGIHDDISASQKTVYDVTDSGTSSSETKVSDTPDTLINESQDYAGSVSQGSGATGNVKTGSVTTEIRGGGGTLENVNANVDAWRDLESQLVAEYAKAFLSLVWY